MHEFSGSYYPLKKACQLVSLFQWVESAFQSGAGPPQELLCILTTPTV